MRRLIQPWSNVRNAPNAVEHPDIKGIYLNYYVNKMGQLVPLWPAAGPMSWKTEDE